MSQYFRGILGCILLAVGVFLPVVEIPIIGEMTYFENSSIESSILLALVAVSGTLIATRRFNGLLATGGISLIVMIYTYAVFSVKMAKLKHDLGGDLEGNPFRGVNEMMLNSIHPAWGWTILIAGSLMLMWASRAK